jgi:hypothetical protein
MPCIEIGAILVAAVGVVAAGVTALTGARKDRRERKAEKRQTQVRLHLKDCQRDAN